MTAPRDATRIVDDLARDTPREVAVSWVHTAAALAHADRYGLHTPRPGAGLADALCDFAAAHPALAAFADPAACRAVACPPPADVDRAIRDLWAEHGAALDDPPNRSVAADPDVKPRPTGFAVGDLYQALSEEARKGRALVQTPEFVAELLLGLGLDPAIAEHGEQVRMIDPACGTGHILIKAALRLVAGRRGPSVARFGAALASVHGVDLDPYAAAVARYRLLTLACRYGGQRIRFDQADRDLPIHVAAADSLLDRSEPLLARGQYHSVIANPPYITVKDPQVREAIRAAYPQVCHGKYPLGLPFTVLMHDLVVPGGWVAQITSNAFMKREFGRRFIEDYLPRFDLRWVIDTSGAYIPGHGTPTVILLTRNRPPAGDKVRAVLGIRGEPCKPDDPARGVVWTQIADRVRERLALDAFAAGAAQAAAERYGGTVDADVPVEAGVAAGDDDDPAGQLPLFGAA